MTEWRDIETAPKDGDYLIYQVQHGERHILAPRICFKSDGGSRRVATHWMPLPAPPIQKENE